MSAFGFTEGYIPVGDGSVSYRPLSREEAKDSRIPYKSPCNVCSRVLRPKKQSDQKPLTALRVAAETAVYSFFHSDCYAPKQPEENTVEHEEPELAQPQQRQEPSLLGRIFQPKNILLGGLAIAAVAGAMYFASNSGSTGMELRCFKDLTQDRLAYCAQMPSGLTAEERERIPFRDYMAEDQYLPLPGGTDHSYSVLRDQGAEEFVHLEW